MAATLSPERRAKAIELGRRAQQVAFDFEALMRQPWEGPAPLHFTTEYFTVDELGAAWDRYIEENGHFGCLVFSHMWARPGWDQVATAAPEGHMYFEMSTDLRPRCGDVRGRALEEETCSCVGMSLTRIQCDGCRFLHIGSREQGVVLWHDAHWPGWRELPVCPPVEGGPQKQQEHDRKFALANYPAEWQVEGAPVITTRERHSTRSVPGRSPWKGMDIASWNLRWDASDPMQWDYDFQREVLEAEEARDRAIATAARYASHG